MNATEAFTAFVTRVLVPAKARRVGELASSQNGQDKVLEGLCHDFEPAIREATIRTKDYSKLWEQPCYVFHSRIGFGAEFPKVRDAYDKLAIEDSWLILLQDASAGNHRPEARWDDEKLIAG